jgi:hypothetical protein
LPLRFRTLPGLLSALQSHLSETVVDQFESVAVFQVFPPDQTAIDKGIDLLGGRQFFGFGGPHRIGKAHPVGGSQALFDELTQAFRLAFEGLVVKPLDDEPAFSRRDARR